MIRVLARLKRLRRDERGVSAVEFALIAPVMILFYFGLAEVTQVMIAAVCPNVGATTEAVPADLLANGESVVMSRVTYTYIGPTNMVMRTNPTFTKTFYLRPRMSNVVTCVGC